MEKVGEGLRISSKIKTFDLDKTEGELNIENKNVSIDDLSKQYLYKTMKFEYVNHMLTHKQLRLENTSSWDDPYENYFLKERFHEKNVGFVDARSHIKQTFGQSWTDIEESDALWRIYSPDCNSVRIKVNARKLVESVLLDESSLPVTFIGKVQYRSETAINSIVREKVERAGFQDVWNMVMPQMFFYKRNEFHHEHEFRIIRMIDSEEYSRYSPSYVVFDIDPNDLIEEICFDPRLCRCAYMVRKKNLLTLGYRGKICQSQLYNFSPIDIELP